MEAITVENAFNVDIPKLALDVRFGSLIFEQSSKKLLKAQEALKEVFDLQYQDLLLQDDVKRIGNLKKQLAGHLEWLRAFDIGAVTNAKQEHDSFNSRIDGFYNEVYTLILMKVLPFLREERRRENPDQQQVDEEIKKVVQLRTELENELKSIKEETQKIRTTDKNVGSAKGERGAARMAAHFDSEVARYEKIKKRWFYGVVGGYVTILIVLAWLGAESYASISQAIKTSQSIDISNTVGIAAIKNLSNSIWGLVVTKLVILAALWYGLSFIIKNYNVNSQLVAVNRHRAAVARTLEDFIAVEQQQANPHISETLRSATDAMFKHAPIGFVSKTEKEANNPILQVVNDLIGIRNNN
jgi:hypothetical protein